MKTTLFKFIYNTSQSVIWTSYSYSHPFECVASSHTDESLDVESPFVELYKLSGEVRFTLHALMSNTSIQIFYALFWGFLTSTLWRSSASIGAIKINLIIFLAQIRQIYSSNTNLKKPSSEFLPRYEQFGHIISQTFIITLSVCYTNCVLI